MPLSLAPSKKNSKKRTFPSHCPKNMTEASTAVSTSSSSTATTLPLLSQPFFQRLEDHIVHLFDEHRSRSADASRRVMRQLVVKHATTMQPYMRQFLLERVLAITEQRQRLLAWLERSVASPQQSTTATTTISSSQPLPSAVGGATGIPSTFVEWHEGFTQRIAAIDALHQVSLKTPSSVWRRGGGGGGGE